MAYHVKYIINNWVNFTSKVILWGGNMKASEIAELKKIHKYNVILGSLLAVLK